MDAGNAERPEARGESGSRQIVDEILRDAFVLADEAYTDTDQFVQALSRMTGISDTDLIDWYEMSEVENLL